VAFRDLGLWYHAFQPSWYCQFLDNQILEGNYYHWNEAADSVLEVSGAKHEPYQGPLNIGVVLRGNQLHGQSYIRVSGSCRDVVVEGNRVAHADRGIFVSRDTARVLVKDNQFEDVAQPVLDEVAEQKAAEAKLARYLGRKEPVAIWDFGERLGEKFADASGNGFPASPIGQPTPARPPRSLARPIPGETAASPGIMRNGEVHRAALLSEPARNRPQPALGPPSRRRPGVDPMGKRIAIAKNSTGQPRRNPESRQTGDQNSAPARKTGRTQNRWSNPPAESETGENRKRRKSGNQNRAVAPDLEKHRENGHESRSAGQGTAGAKKQEMGNQNASPGRNPQSHETDDEFPTPHQRRDKT
jgi:DNA-binding cell septation regulator SpoVG